MAGHKVRPSLRVGLGAAALTLLSIGSASADFGQHHCAILNHGAVKCWGPGWRGMLGLGDVVPRGEDPALMGNNLPTVNLGTDRTAVQMATSYESTCAILDNGKAKCWGSGESGKHGRGDTQHYGARSAEMGDNLPYLDLGLGRTVTKIVGAGSGYCALLENERVKCWGYNSAGQLGQGDTETRGDEPNEMGDNLPYIDLGTNAQGQAYAVKNIAAGSFAACAVLEKGARPQWRMEP